MTDKVDGKHPASYSDLLLAVQKLERCKEARDPLPLKTAAASGSKMTHSQMPGNLFPSCKLKGDYTFVTQAATIRNDEAVEDSSVKQEGEGEKKPLTDEDVELSG